jgi:hypothetical protein
MIKLKEYFQPGNLYKDRECYVLGIYKFSELNSKTLPFFKKNPVLGKKGQDFSEWAHALELINQKAHLT